MRLAAHTPHAARNPIRADVSLPAPSHSTTPLRDGAGLSADFKNFVHG